MVDAVFAQLVAQVYLSLDRSQVNRPVGLFVVAEPAHGLQVNLAHICAEPGVFIVQQ